MNKNLDLFLTFLKIGATTFGGGYAMIPQIKNEFVEKKKWITEDEMVEMIAVSESTPGPIAINMATYIGYKENRVLGSLFSTLGVILPSIIIVFIISFFFNKFIDNKYVSYAFIGIKCAVSFLIIKAGIELIKKMEKKIIPIILFSITFILAILMEIFKFHFSSIYLILFGAFIGIIMYALFYRKKDDKEDKKWFIYYFS